MPNQIGCQDPRKVANAIRNALDNPHKVGRNVQRDQTIAHCLGSLADAIDEHQRDHRFVPAAHLRHEEQTGHRNEAAWN